VKDLLREHGGYGVGHVGTVARRDNGRFTSSDAQDILTCLFYFLSFARGFWCGPIVVEGMGARKPLWTEWQSRARLTDWQGVWSWFPTEDAAEAGVAFAGFRELWKRETWSQPLREVIYWYVDANLNAGAIEGSLILAHATLERLSWIHLVTHGGRDEGEFDRDLKSGERIEALLASLGIPPDLPVSFVPELAAWASAESIVGGPWAVAAVRDTLVHPRRRQKRAPTSAHARLRARQLASTTSSWYSWPCVATTGAT
jgi:hypothetical protein